jgi:hypothetical protein
MTASINSGQRLPSSKVAITVEVAVIWQDMKEPSW